MFSTCTTKRFYVQAWLAGVVLKVGELQGISEHASQLNRLQPYLAAAETKLQPALFRDGETVALIVAKLRSVQAEEG